ncbi:jg13337 [Pararge aegeria aegeria]|uniref:Jg13337 protein n=1 Tax=Pararge aegeria aegeria TaxID=348720 RepID=A0A8S4SBT2_9NEOP|nr:jg13337 [Pararge aegeria aegeria]
MKPISETHCVSNSLLKIKGYNIYHTNHPDGTAHGGTVILKSTINHFELPQYRTEQIQATSIALSDRNGDLNISAVYCPPKHKISKELFTDYFRSLGNRFVVGGDWNAKHLHWGSRLITTRGTELKNFVDKNFLTTIATPEPTHWPTDPNRLPDVLDCFIFKGLSRSFFTITSSLDGSSNHIPVILTIGTTILKKQNVEPSPVCCKRTVWEAFRSIVNEELQLQIAHKSEEDIDDATNVLMTTIQSACWKCTPEDTSPLERHVVLAEIKLVILEKRRLRRLLHNSRHPQDKTVFNKASKDLKTIIAKVNGA